MRVISITLNINKTRKFIGIIVEKKISQLIKRKPI